MIFLEGGTTMESVRIERPVVVNMRTCGTPTPHDVRIDRRTKWGNPYRIGRDGTRQEVIAQYRAYLLSRPDLMAALPELRGKRLLCHCAPLACHGDVLADLVMETRA
jgi:hypothetical protein